MTVTTIDLLDLELPVTLRSDTPATDEQLLLLSQRHHPCRIERNRDGEITIMTPVGGIGSTHEIFVASALFQWTEAHHGGVSFGSNAGFHLPDDSCLSPDAAWLSLSRWEALTAEERAGYPPLCPEFIIEIRSRSDSRRTLEDKMQLWIGNGAAVAWLLDPLEASATIYGPGRSTETLQRPDFIVGTGPVAGFELRSSRLWNPPDSRGGV